MTLSIITSEAPSKKNTNCRKPWPVFPQPSRPLIIFSHLSEPTLYICSIKLYKYKNKLINVQCQNFIITAFLAYEVWTLWLGCALWLCWRRGSPRRFATFLILCGMLAGSIARGSLVVGAGLWGSPKRSLILSLRNRFGLLFLSGGLLFILLGFIWSR